MIYFRVRLLCYAMKHHIKSASVKLVDSHKFRIFL